MNSFITKKATVIYRASSFFLYFFFLFFTSGAFAQTDINSFCFEDSVNLKSVENSITFLLLPADTINLREEDHCIDIVASVDRGKLFEKFLAGRYNLRRANREMTTSGPAEIQTCQLALRTTVKQKSENQTAKVGEKNSLSKSEKMLTSTSSMELVLSLGVPGEMEAGNEKLKVICRLIGSSKINLQFSFADKAKGGLTSEFSLAKGEWLNVGSVIKDLNEKNKTLGIPQTEASSVSGISETVYELQIK